MGWRAPVRGAAFRRALMRGVQVPKTRGQARHFVAVVGIVIVALLMPQERSEATAVRRPARQVHRTLRLQPCRVPNVQEVLRCGIFWMPENRSLPHGRLLPLKVIVLPAKEPLPELGPVFRFEGGPGMAVTESVTDDIDLPYRLHHDIVLVDQRGTGEGNWLDCHVDNSDTDLQPLFSAGASFSRCRDQLQKKET